MSPLSAKLVNCPNCTQKIGRKQRIEKCAFCGKLLCTRCVDSSRFCRDCAKQIPPEFKQRLRWLNPFVPMLLVTVASLIIGQAWYTFPGWQAQDPMGTLEDLGVVLLWWMGGCLLIFIAVKLPHLGTWFYYSWLAKPANRAKIEAAIKEQAEGRYQPQSYGYRFKQGLIETNKKWGNKAIIFAALGCNLLTFIFWIIQLVTPITAISQFAGVIWAVGYIASIIMVGVAAGFYCKRTDENRQNRRKIELLSWGYLLLFPLAFVAYLLRAIAILEAWDAVDILQSLPTATLPYTVAYTVVFGLQTAVLVLLGWQMLRVQPVWRVPSTYERRNVRWSFRWMVNLTGKIVLGVFALMFTAFSIGLIITGFPPIYWALPEITYLLLVIAYVPVFVMLLKMIPWKPHRYKQVYWTAVKVFAVVVGISLVPTLSVGWTDSGNNAQFTAVFGPDWESQALARQTVRGRTLGREYRFSMFDAMFGFDISKVNEKRDITYINDTKKYGNTSLHDVFKFDAYLPADLNFDDGKPEKLPVLIMTHGSGMDRGYGNMINKHRFFASRGFLVCDMSYGGTGNGDRENDGDGYALPDIVNQLGNFTKTLEANASYYHADMNNVYFSGISLGGYFALTSAYGYNKSYMAGNFSATMKVRGVIPFYPVSDVGLDSQYFDFVGMGQDDGPLINGSSNEDDPNYNPQWKWYNPGWLVQNATQGTLCPTLVFQGSHDTVVPPGWSRQLIARCHTSGNVGIISPYILQSHAYDALHWGPPMQSTLYYMERFLALTLTI